MERFDAALTGTSSTFSIAVLSLKASIMAS
jgi:hypothetical protein